jgi:hypothetical protein
MDSYDADLGNFQSLLGGLTPVNPQHNARAVRQLLAEEPDCRAHLHFLGWDDARLRHLLLLPSIFPQGEDRAVDSRFDYGPAFAKAERSLTAACAEALLAELEGLPEALRLSRIASGARFGEPELIGAKLDESRRAAGP